MVVMVVVVIVRLELVMGEMGGKDLGRARTKKASSFFDTYSCESIRFDSKFGMLRAVP